MIGRERFLAINVRAESTDHFVFHSIYDIRFINYGAARLVNDNNLLFH